MSRKAVSAQCYNVLISIHISKQESKTVSSRTALCGATCVPFLFTERCDRQSFWTLVKLPSYEFKKEYSMSALKKNFAGAIINEDLFQLIKNELSRAKMEQVLIQTYLFSQIGRKIYVNRADLDAYLRRHRIDGK